MRKFERILKNAETREEVRIGAVEREDGTWLVRASISCHDGFGIVRLGKDVQTNDVEVAREAWRRVERRYAAQGFRRVEEGRSK